MSRTAIGIDVGGTFAKVAAVSASGRILRQTQVPTEAALGPAAFVSRLAPLVESWRGTPGLSLDAAGLGLAGDVDTDAGLRRQFNDEVPVVFIDGRKAFKYHMDEREFLRKLAS